MEMETVKSLPNGGHTFGRVFVSVWVAWNWIEICEHLKNLHSKVDVTVCKCFDVGVFFLLFLQYDGTKHWAIEKATFQIDSKKLNYQWRR